MSCDFSRHVPWASHWMQGILDDVVNPNKVMMSWGQHLPWVLEVPRDSYVLCNIFQQVSWPTQLSRQSLTVSMNSIFLSGQFWTKWRKHDSLLPERAKKDWKKKKLMALLYGCFNIWLGKFSSYRIAMSSFLLLQSNIQFPLSWLKSVCSHDGKIQLTAAQLSAGQCCTLWSQLRFNLSAFQWHYGKEG